MHPPGLNAVMTHPVWKEVHMRMCECVNVCFKTLSYTTFQLTAKQGLTALPYRSALTNKNNTHTPVSWQGEGCSALLLGPPHTVPLLFPVPLLLSAVADRLEKHCFQLRWQPALHRERV